MRKDANDNLPRTIGRYQLLRHLGSGGLAQTYMAVDTSNGEIVALKELHLVKARERKQIELFEREAATLAKIDHPQIPRFIDSLVDRGESVLHLCLVQEFITGLSLQTLVDLGYTFTESEVVAIMESCLEPLGYLHDQHTPIYHRDIKPSNIILRPRGDCVLIDFGAVRETIGPPDARGSSVVGTFGYMAPEQFRAQAYPGTDLYGLGATAFHLLTGIQPVTLELDRLKLLIRPHLEDRDPGIITILDLLLEPMIEDRYPSVNVLRRALRRWQENAGIEAEMPTPYEGAQASKAREAFDLFVDELDAVRRHTPYGLKAVPSESPNPFNAPAPRPTQRGKMVSSLVSQEFAYDPPPAPEPEPIVPTRPQRDSNTDAVTIDTVTAHDRETPPHVSAVVVPPAEEPAEPPTKPIAPLPAPSTRKPSSIDDSFDEAATPPRPKRDSTSPGLRGASTMRSHQATREVATTPTRQQPVVGLDTSETRRPIINPGETLHGKGMTFADAAETAVFAGRQPHGVARRAARRARRTSAQPLLTQTTAPSDTNVTSGPARPSTRPLDVGHIFESREIERAANDRATADYAVVPMAADDSKPSVDVRDTQPIPEDARRGVTDLLDEPTPPSLPDDAALRGLANDPTANPWSQHEPTPIRMDASSPVDETVPTGDELATSVWDDLDEAPSEDDPFGISSLDATNIDGTATWLSAEDSADSWSLPPSAASAELPAFLQEFDDVDPPHDPLVDTRPIPPQLDPPRADRPTPVVEHAHEPDRAVGVASPDATLPVDLPTPNESAVDTSPDATIPAKHDTPVPEADSAQRERDRAHFQSEIAALVRESRRSSEIMSAIAKPAAAEATLPTPEAPATQASLAPRTTGLLGDTMDLDQGLEEGASTLSLPDPFDDPDLRPAEPAAIATTEPRVEPAAEPQDTSAPEPAGVATVVETDTETARRDAVVVPGALNPVEDNPRRTSRLLGDMIEPAPSTAPALFPETVEMQRPHLDALRAFARTGESTSVTDDAPPADLTAAASAVEPPLNTDVVEPATTEAPSAEPLEALPETPADEAPITPSSIPMMTPGGGTARPRHAVPVEEGPNSGLAGLAPGGHGGRELGMILMAIAIAVGLGSRFSASASAGLLYVGGGLAAYALLLLMVPRRVDPHARVARGGLRAASPAITRVVRHRAPMAASEWYVEYTYMADGLEFDGRTRLPSTAYAKKLAKGDLPTRVVYSPHDPAESTFLIRKPRR